jgi:hypothetical protein
MELHFKNIIERFTGTEPVTREELTNPYRDWNIVLGLFVIVSVALIACSSYLFWRISAGGLFEGSASESTSVQTLDRDALLQTVQLLEEKEAAYRTLLETRPSYPSP